MIPQTCNNSQNGLTVDAFSLKYPGNETVDMLVKKEGKLIQQTYSFRSALLKSKQ